MSYLPLIPLEIFSAKNALALRRTMLLLGVCLTASVRKGRGGGKGTHGVALLLCTSKTSTPTLLYLMILLIREP